MSGSVLDAAIGSNVWKCARRCY